MLYILEYFLLLSMFTHHKSLLYQKVYLKCKIYFGQAVLSFTLMFFFSAMLWVYKTIKRLHCQPSWFYYALCLQNKGGERVNNPSLSRCFIAKSVLVNISTRNKKNKDMPIFSSEYLRHMFRILTLFVHNAYVICSELLRHLFRTCAAPV